MYSFFSRQLLIIAGKLSFLFCVLAASSGGALAQSVTLTSQADAYIRNGTYSSTNYGNDTSLLVKGTTSSGYSRSSYLKFSLSSVTVVGSAKLRLYGRNTENTTSIIASVYSV